MICSLSCFCSGVEGVGWGYKMEIASLRVGVMKGLPALLWPQIYRHTNHLLADLE